MSRILLVDDSESIHLLLTHFLTQHGFEMSSAKTAEEGFQAIKRKLPDLILLDVQLPDMSGFEFCRLLRSQALTRTLPIIMITSGATRAKDRVAGLQSGADDYLAKPLETDELLERIRAVLRRSGNRSRYADSQAPTPELPHAQDVKTTSSARLLSTRQAITYALFSPLSVTGDLPPVAVIFLLTMTLLLSLGLTLSSDLAFRPLMVGLFALFTWGFLVSLLVILSSLIGIALPWKEGSRLFSLACIPLLLKFAGGVVLSGVTTLSPFLFTVGPGLLLPSTPLWAYRLDVYEIWSVGLLWIFLRRRPGSSVMKTTCVVIFVYATAIFLLFGIQQLRGQL